MQFGRFHLSVLVQIPLGGAVTQEVGKALGHTTWATAVCKCVHSVKEEIGWLEVNMNRPEDHLVRVKQHFSLGKFVCYYNLLKSKLLHTMAYSFTTVLFNIPESSALLFQYFDYRKCSAIIESWEICILKFLPLMTLCKNIGILDSVLPFFI